MIEERLSPQGPSYKMERHHLQSQGLTASRERGDEPRLQSCLAICSGKGSVNSQTKTGKIPRTGSENPSPGIDTVSLVAGGITYVRV